MATSPYYPTKAEIEKQFDIWNKKIFGSKLKRFRKIIIHSKRGAWAMTDLRLSKARKVPYTILEMNSVYPSFQTFVEILVHEMIHHYQWTVDKYPQSQCEHGRSNFFCWKPKLAKHNLKLYEGFKEVIIKHER